MLIAKDAVIGIFFHKMVNYMHYTEFDVVECLIYLFKPCDFAKFQSLTIY